MTGQASIRKLRDDDPIPEITALLHAAYAPLAAMGFRYTATHQDDDVTRRRLDQGRPRVATLDGRIVATITLYDTPPEVSNSRWYLKSGVWRFGQFAVRPDLQGKGLGRRLMETVEQEAIDGGALELALDTAEGALHLIRWYERLGYRFIEHADWSTTNYRSVILSKSLPASPS